jgi:hypothetical protein
LYVRTVVAEPKALAGDFKNQIPKVQEAINAAVPHGLLSEQLQWHTNVHWSFDAITALVLAMCSNLERIVMNPEVGHIYRVDYLYNVLGVSERRCDECWEQIQLWRQNFPRLRTFTTAETRNDPLHPSSMSACVPV